MGRDRLRHRGHRVTAQAVDRQVGSGSPQPRHSGGVKLTTAAQHPSQTAPSSGWGMGPPQAAQGGAKSRASARLARARSVTGDGARAYSGASSPMASGAYSGASSSMASGLAVPHSRSSP
jgi:hypothetical protein